MTHSEYSKQKMMAAKLAAEEVAAVARQHNTPILVWESGDTIEINPFTGEKTKRIKIESKLDQSNEGSKRPSSR
jgi:hypothetical protein